MKKLTLSAFFLFTFSVYSQNYIPDNTFGTNGSKVFTGSSTAANPNPESGPIEIYFIDNKYVLVQEYQIARFNYDGERDLIFGTNGKCVLNGNNKYYNIKGVKMHNGFFYVCGQVELDGYKTNAFLARISPQGFLDPSFGNQGIAIFDFGNDPVNLPDNDQFSDLDISSDGSIFTISGIRTGENDADMIVCKVTPQGNFDTTFNSQGFKSYFSEGSFSSSGKKIFNYQDGFLLLGSQTLQLSTSPILTKINGNSEVDTNFAVNGIYGAPTYQNAILDGNIMIFSYGSNGNGGFTVVDLNNFETQFWSGNVMLTNPIIKLDNDKILATDITCQGVNCYTGIGFKLRRYTFNGNLDTTFNSSGSYSYSFPGNSPLVTFSHPSAVYVHDDGKILMAGKIFYESGYDGLGMLRLIPNTLEVTNYNTGKLAIYPNPASTFLYIENADNYILENLSIFDATGRIITVKLTGNKVDISQLQSGQYILHLTSGNEIINTKFIKN